jgi:hypothetical protein
MYTGIFAGRAALYHPGDNPGYQSHACWIPDLGPGRSGAGMPRWTSRSSSMNCSHMAGPPSASSSARVRSRGVVKRVLHPPGT